MQKIQADPIDVTVGARIRARRQFLHMTQSALGATVGVSFQAMQKYESGDIRVSASRLDAIARALGVMPSHFFGEHATAEELRYAEEVADLARRFLRLTPPRRSFIASALRLFEEGEAERDPRTDALATIAREGSLR